MTEDTNFLLGDFELETAELEGIQVVRDLNEKWRYADTWVEVPGARDITLTERFAPKFIVSGEEIERVVVDAVLLHLYPELLGWCEEVGTPVYDAGEELTEVLVPFAEWNERDRIPGELFSPEHHGSEAEQELARAERELREAEKHFENAAETRAEVLRRRSREMTRQEARKVTGLSIGRVQQLISNVPLNEREREVLEMFETGPIEKLRHLVKVARDNEVPGKADELLAVARGLRNRGLLGDVDEGRALGITEEGTQLLYEAQFAEIEAEAEES